MKQASNYFSSDTSVLPYIIRMKQNEDIVPQEFSRTNKAPFPNDSNKLLREKYLESTEYRKGSMKDHFISSDIQTNVFPVFLLLVSLGFLLFSKLFYWKGYKQLIDSHVSHIKFRYWLRDQGSVLSGIFLYAMPAYFILLSLTICLYFTKQAGKENTIDPLLFLFVLLILLCWFFFREFLMWIAKIIFQSHKSTSEQRQNIYIHAVLTTILLALGLPVFIYYPGSGIFQTILIINLFVELVRIIKAIYFALKLREFGTYYFFLYFCTVEIIPLLILIKTGILFSTHFQF